MISAVASVVGDDVNEARRIAALIVNDSVAFALLRDALKEKKPKAAKAEKPEKPAKAEKPKKTEKPKVVKKKAEKPESSEDAPDASEYRLDSSDIDADKCVGRTMSAVKTWKPHVYREAQCGKETAEGDLCKGCAAKAEKFAADSKYNAWNGRVTETPLDHTHMLGTAWAEKTAPVFLGDVVSSSASVAEEAPEKAAVAAEPETEKVIAEKAEKAEKPEKAAAKAAKDEKAAAKAEKAAAAAAEKAAKAAAKEAEKAAKAVKAAAKAKPEKAEKPKKKVVEAKVEVAEPTVAGDLQCIDGTIFMIKKGFVYEYNELSEETGDCVGKLRPDGTVDGDAVPEDDDAESTSS
jgi:hypothetical protein